MKKKRKILKHILIYSGIFLICLLFYTGSTLYASKNFIEVTTYEYPSDKIDTPIDILVISDAHAHNFGEGNKDLTQKVKNEHPDIILLDGDIINFYEKNADYLKNMVSDLKEIAPVYYTIGNHEASYISTKKEDLKSLVDEAGGIYLDQDYVDITVKNQHLRIGGLYDYAYNNLQVPQEQYLQKGSYQFLQDYSNTDSFTLLMSHRPESFIDNDEDARWPIDLVVSGHEHGGQIRLPFIGGFYSTHKQSKRICV